MSEYELRPYQIEGAEFLARKGRALLGDEPGVGKSAQAVVACDIVAADRVLVLCPASARVNWCREFDKFSIYGREHRCIMSQADRPLKQGVTTCSLDLATPLKEPLRKDDESDAAYEARRAGWRARTKLCAALMAIEWDVVILDESHYLANRKNARSRFIWTKIAPKAKRVFCLSGTPAGNHLGDVWTTAHHLGAFPGDYWSFVDKFCEGFNDGWQFKITGAKRAAMPEFKEMMGKIMLRRKKSDVLQDLPKITFAEVEVAAGPVDPIWFPTFDKFRDETLEEHVEKARLTVAGTLSLVGDTSLSLGHMTMTTDALQGLDVPMGTMRQYVALQKVPGIVDLLNDELENGLDKIVLFAFHRSVIMELQQRLRKYKPITYFGGMPGDKRQKAIDDFQNDPKRRVFIGQIVACGTAVTLTAAASVMLIEPSWNPVVNAQAVMRVHRFGQERPVLARFVTIPDPVDQRLQEVLRKKTRALALADLDVA